MGKKNLPVKIVLPRNSDIKKNTVNGGRLKFFGEVTEEVVNNVIMDFEQCLEYYQGVFAKEGNIPAIGKVKIKENAIAKSHKPQALCKECNIIGIGNLDEIYIKLTPESIKKTINKIKTSPTQELYANISTFKSVTPIEVDEKISNYIKLMHKNNDIEKDFNLKIKLFDFNNEKDNYLIENYVISEIEKINNREKIELKEFGNKIKYLKLQVESYDKIVQIAGINGVKSVDIIQTYSSFRMDQQILKDKISISDEDADESDTIIGIIDSGISTENKMLERWIYDREVFVKDIYQNPYHGTFVASQIQYGNILNGIQEHSNKRYKFLDVIAIPNSDSRYGNTDSISEDDLMDIIQEVVEKHHEKVKIWNLSFGNPSNICDGTISDLGVFCDDIQEKYNVQFIISAGNIEDEELLRTWPPTEEVDEERIISPGDSIRGITVGSLSHIDDHDSLVKKNQPSPFSRRGPGPSFIVKPDLVDFGGNCRADFNCTNIGMIGLDPKGNLVEDIGTSFSTPRIVRKYADIVENMDEEDLLLSKAMLIHSARSNSRKILDINQDNIKYFGFGIPSENSNEILMCSENEITLIFKSKIVDGVHLEMLDFPYPESLIKNKKYTGEIYMTLAYNPPLNANFGQEYCRSNIDVSFGTYKYDTEGNIKFKGQVPIEKNWESKFEKEQVQNGFKWSPIKSYYRNIPNGIDIADGWKLKIIKHSRHNLDIKEQEFILIVTIKDTSDSKQDIYSEVVRGLRENGFIALDLDIRNKVRNKS